MWHGPDLLIFWVQDSSKGGLLYDKLFHCVNLKSVTADPYGVQNKDICILYCWFPVVYIMRSIAKITVHRPDLQTLWTRANPSLNVKKLLSGFNDEVQCFCNWKVWTCVFGKVSLSRTKFCSRMLNLRLKKSAYFNCGIYECVHLIEIRGADVIRKECINGSKLWL